MNSFTKHIIGYITTAVLMGGGGILLNRNDNTIRNEPAKIINAPNNKKVYIRKAIVWGSEDKIEVDTLITLWRSKIRKTPEALMLAKALHESAFCPYIFRYEFGQHKDNPLWKKYTEFQATSGGLFQLMGFNWQYSPDNWDDLLSIEKQLDAYDNFMFHCFYLAELAKTEKPLEYRVIAAYFNTSTVGATAQNILIEANYQTFLRFQNKDSILLKNLKINLL